MQQIVLLLLFRGDQTKVSDPMAQSPWLEMVASQTASGTDPNRAIANPIHPTEHRLVTDTPTMAWKTHSPSQLVPWKGGLNALRSKVIVVVRNPNDAAVSLYHHTMDSNDKWKFSGDFDDFLHMFMDGNVESGSYWEWYSNWWAANAHNPDTILWVKFEDLKADLRGQVERISDFLGCELSQSELDLVSQASTFEAMKAQQKTIDAKKEAEGKRIKKNHIRRGKVGTWREVFAESHITAFDELNGEYNASEWTALV